MLRGVYFSLSENRAFGPETFARLGRAGFSPDTSGSAVEGTEGEAFPRSRFQKWSLEFGTNDPPSPACPPE